MRIYSKCEKNEPNRIIIKFYQETISHLKLASEWLKEKEARKRREEAQLRAQAIKDVERGCKEGEQKERGLW